MPPRGGISRRTAAGGSRSRETAAAHGAKGRAKPETANTPAARRGTACPTLVLLGRGTGAPVYGNVLPVAVGERRSVLEVESLA